MKNKRSPHTSQEKKALKQRVLFPSVPSQVQTLKYLARSFAFLKSDSCVVTHRAMGSYLNYYRETTSRATTALANQGFITKRWYWQDKKKKISSPNEFKLGPNFPHTYFFDHDPEYRWAILQKQNALYLKERSQSRMITPSISNSELYKNIATNLIASNSRPAGGGSLDNPPSRAGCRGRCFFCLEEGENMITTYNKQLAQQYGITRYGQVLLSAFPDSVLVDAVAQMKLDNPQNPVTWLFKRCGELCKSRSIQPYYEEMTKEIEEKGYKPGDKLIFSSDPDAQFRYNEPKPVKYSRPERPKKGIDMNNPFLARFGIPEWVKENDQAKERS